MPIRFAISGRYFPITTILLLQILFILVFAPEVPSTSLLVEASAKKCTRRLFDEF